MSGGREHHPQGHKEGIAVASSTDLRRLSLDMVRASRRYLDLISRDLDPAVFDTRDFVTAVKSMITKNPQARVRIIVLRPETLIGVQHRLVDLSQRLTSFMAIRRPGPDHREFNEALMICDQRHLIHRKLSDRFDGHAWFDAPGRAAKLQQAFNELWEYGEPDPNFRQLFL
jgi:hypothetical protein